jgi:aspartate-semialdehyde dehydrogenase
MTSTLNIGIVGATGAVGQEIIKLLEKRNLPIAHLTCFGSNRSQGLSLPFKGEKIPVKRLCPSSFDGLDVVFFSAGSSVSKEYADLSRKKNVLMIDNSSAFRQDPKVPLIIPEVNPEDVKSRDLLIANPNCAVILLLMVLAPLHAHAKLKRIVLSTYQAASGAGLRAMQELQGETLAFLQNLPFERKAIPHPYAFNLFLHNSPMGPGGYVQEEIKLIQETKKILKDETLRISATCVRVPVLRAHAESVNAEFHFPLSKTEAYKILNKAPGVKIVDDFEENRFAMPVNAAGQDPIFCSRIREDLSQDNTLDLWIVGDQLLKGAALNAVQILELMMDLRKKEQVAAATRSNLSKVKLQT